jgi:RNA polymerase sigma-70 factor (ECF subfamily)
LAPNALLTAHAEIREIPAPRSPELEVIVLFDQYRAPVLRYLISRRIPLSDAEEIVQEVFVALFRHLRAAKSRSNLPGWIFTVAHNMALKFRISGKRRSHLFEDAPGMLDRAESSLDNPEQQLTAKQYRIRLMSVVQALPEQDRSCLALRAEGFRYREIARMLGISLGSVANSLTRALARLSRI